jgi:hypothetical protein
MPPETAPPADGQDARHTAATDCVARLYHAWTTGLVLTLVARVSPAAAEEFVFRLFRTQHLARFLPGLEKLGLTAEPHAVAAAKYHYFSNQLGGVRVEYLEESAQKAWVRYPPPRWIWLGTAICGIPSAVNRAMLRGWHAHNGVSLGNPRLGFVCTKTTVDGQPGLEGYYLEHDHELSEDERLRFRPDESCPRIDPATLPALDAERWPAIRRAKAYRSYAMEYVRNALPVLVALLGPEEARWVGRIAGLHVGMHCWEELRARLGVTGTDAAAFTAVLADLLAASGDDVAVEDGVVVRRRWALFPEPVPEAAFEAWAAPWRGMLAVHDRFLRLDVERAGGVDRFVVRDNPRGA